MKKYLALIFTLFSIQGSAADFFVTSSDIREGYPMDELYMYKGFNCTGGNQSPQLSWHNPPKGTKSFAITAFDPDAPTGSGWWHWIVLNIPKNIKQISRGQDMYKLPSTPILNDFSSKNYGGLCPPIGQGMHRLQFTVWALPSETANLPENPSVALVGFYLNNNSIGKAMLTATGARP